MLRQCMFLVMLSARVAAYLSAGAEEEELHVYHGCPLQLLQVNVLTDASARASVLQQATPAPPANRSASNALGRTYGNPGSCDKVTTGTCFFTDKCSPSRNAACTDGFKCTCSELMCHDGKGACRLSPYEIKAAVASGVQTVENVIEQVSTVMGVATDTANSIVEAVTGSADAVSKSTGIFGGVAESVNSAWSGFMNTTSEGCNRYVSSCILSGCPSSVEGKASCSWPKCLCNPNYCYESRRGQDMCIYDMRKIFDFFGPRAGS